MKQMFHMIVLAAVLTGSWVVNALAGPHCCPIIVEDVNLIQDEQLLPNATFHIPVPILGRSTHRTRGHPSVVMMSVHLPENYSRKKPHPVVVHLGGGVDQRKFIGRWTSITGNKDFIILLAEYTSRLDSGPRNASQMLRILEAATPIKHGAVILAGISSGSWGMNTNFDERFYPRGYMDPWDGFIFIEGNNNRHVSVTAEKLRGRPALFVGGNHGGARAIQLKTHEEITAAGGDSTFIDEVSHYSDFPASCDPQIMAWINDKVLSRIKEYEKFQQNVKAIETVKVSADVKAQGYINALKFPLFDFAAKSECMVRYLDLVKAEKDEAKRKQMIDALRDIPNLPVTQGGPYQESLLWLKTQPGCEDLAIKLALHNPFVNQVVFPPKAPENGNGYGPDVNFRAR